MKGLEFVEKLREESKRLSLLKRNYLLLLDKAQIIAMMILLSLWLIKQARQLCVHLPTIKVVLSII
jgi:hypothetical protein